MALFSIIIPAFNRAHLLPEALESVFKQTCTDYEIIVVDDGSTDNTKKIVESYGSKVHFFQQQNRGPGAARNLGAIKSSGEYLTFLDSDDIWLPWTLDAYKQAIDFYKRPGWIAGTGIKYVNKIELLEEGHLDIKCKFHNNYYSAFSESLWIGMCAVCIKKSEFFSVRGFEERRINAEDSDLWMQLGLKHGFVTIESPILFGYRQHDSNTISNHKMALLGIQNLIERELNNCYPGGKKWLSKRRRIISTHTRPASISMVKQGYFSDAWSLYTSSFKINIYCQKIKYLIGFPLLIIKQKIKK